MKAISKGVLSLPKLCTKKTNTKYRRKLGKVLVRKLRSIAYEPSVRTSATGLFLKKNFEHTQGPHPCLIKSKSHLINTMLNRYNSKTING